MRLKDPSLRRYWIEIERMASGPRQFGVTAINLDDAVALIEQSGLTPTPLGSVTRVIEDVDVETVRAEADGLVHMAPPIWRGVWYPMVGPL